MRSKEYDWNNGQFEIGEEVRSNSILDNIRNLVAEHPLAFTVVALVGGIAILKYAVDGFLTREFLDLLKRWER